MLIYKGFKEVDLVNHDIKKAIELLKYQRNYNQNL